MLNKMNTPKILVYDGSFNGFLTAVYTAFEQRIRVSDIQGHTRAQNGLFAETQTIFTKVEKAERVWNGIRAKSATALKKGYFAFLSGYEGIELMLYRYIVSLYGGDVGKDEVIGRVANKIGQLADNVGKAKERIEASLAFQLSRDGVCFATLAPEYDLLPLVAKHFRSRWPQRSWMIYDLKRGYGLFCEQTAMELVTLDLDTLPKLSDSWGGPQHTAEKRNLDALMENAAIRSLIKPKLLRPQANGKVLAYGPTRQAG